MSVVIQSSCEDSLLLPCNLSDNSRFVCDFVVFSDLSFSRNFWCLSLICVFYIFSSFALLLIQTTNSFLIMKQPMNIRDAFGCRLPFSCLLRQWVGAGRGRFPFLFFLVQPVKRYALVMSQRTIWGSNRYFWYTHIIPEYESKD